MLAVQGPRRARSSSKLADGRAAAALPLLLARRSPACRCSWRYGLHGRGRRRAAVSPDGAGDVWDALVEAGVEPVGLGARDTLRLEVNYHLYGNDMDETRNPIEAGLGWACKEDTGFVGADAVRAVREAGPPRSSSPSS